MVTTNISRIYILLTADCIPEREVLTSGSMESDPLVNLYLGALLDLTCDLTL
jgi:hypothetical protein